MKKRMCIIKGDFGNELLKSIDDVLVAEAGEATIEAAPEESPPASHWWHMDQKPKRNS
ncbi:MAG: hypothetical protein ACE5IY_00495 [bacterium]